MATDRREVQAAYYARNRADCAARTLAWEAANPEKVAEKRRRHDLKRKYGITADQYDAMLAAQDGLCAICGRPETCTRNDRVRALCVDHDHVTGAVRSLLCAECNKGIGNLGDDPVRLRAAAAYLEAHRG